MPTGVSGLIKLAIFGIGISPTLLALLAAGIMLGRPKPCSEIPCQPSPYGAEVLLLPIGTGVPFLCGYLLWLVPSGKKRQPLVSGYPSPSLIGGGDKDA